MIDLHTHILPGMDDGARSVEMSLAMLHAQAEQGVETVVLTPHFYRHMEELPRFLKRRKEAVQWLNEGILKDPRPQDIPRLLLGAEVAWVPNMLEWQDLSELCIGGTRNMLLELPFYHWSDDMIRQIYELIDHSGITPVIAHLERYVKNQPQEYIMEILSMDIPIQVSADPLLHFWGNEKGTVLELLRSGYAHIMASDCHNMGKRPPNLRPGMDAVKRKLGSRMVQKLEHYAKELIGEI